MSRSICVYCGSREDVDPRYFAAAAELGQALGRGGHTLVYGGGQAGLMGAIALATHAHGGRVVGVIPHFMVERELAYRDADELILADTMRRRKEIMDERAEAFIALPGGFGTMEELFEVMTGNFLEQSNKPVVVANIAGFYDPLLALFEHFYATGFASAKYRRAYHIAATAEEALALALKV